MVWALIAITFLSYVVWLHHFFTMGAGGDVNAFFGIMTMVIAIPTGVKIFNWLFTMHRGRIHFATPMRWFLAFVVTFSIGGMTGVMMAVPAIDFEVHNSLFLVAHFHNMIIGGVVFGFFAGLTYWFPKVFGFRLNERLGNYAFWCWFIGFLLAFIPLYILGLMGATRRLDHYDPSLGWQGLFIVAGIGVMFVLAGVGFQILQLVVSVRQRHQTRDKTGDPWNGRTLEWSTTSPAPFYNFAVIPTVTDRDAFWAMKQTDQPKNTEYEDIYLPKNTGFGLYIAGASLAIGFALVWHIWWLAAVGLAGLLTLIIVRATAENTEYCLPAEEVARLERGA
jgi:cytochrome o ubiquinol oxidase subunit 1